MPNGNGNKVLVGILAAVVITGTVSIFGYAIHSSGDNRDALDLHEKQDGHPATLKAIDSLEKTQDRHGEILMDLTDSSARQEARQEEILRRLP